MAYHNEEYVQCESKFTNVQRIKENYVNFGKRLIFPLVAEAFIVFVQRAFSYSAIFYFEDQQRENSKRDDVVRMRKFYECTIHW